MENGGISPSNASRKTRLARSGSALWAASGPGSRKFSNVSSNPQVFGGGKAAPSPKHGGGAPGAVSNSSIASAIAQAVAFANSNGNAGSGGNNIPFNNTFSGNTAPMGEYSSSTKNRAPFSSKLRGMAWQEHPQEDDELCGFEDDFQHNEVYAPRKASTSLVKDTSLKLLNKAKISYREVMEG